MRSVLALAVLLTGCPTSEPEPDSLPIRDPLPDRVTSPCAPWAGDAFTPTLAETGCFPDGVPAAGLIPYSVRSPLWTDGAAKERWMVIPEGETVGFSPDGAFDFPDGSVLLKSFLRAPGDPAEVRAMVRRNDGWAFGSWRLDDRDERVDAPIQAPVTMDDGTVVDWYFPDAAGCVTCHAGGALGPVAAQLDTLYDYGDGERTQLADMARIGLFDDLDPRADAPLTDPSNLEASLEERARSWLHGNCSHCHRPGGWTPPEMDMDLRIQTPFAEARVCGVPVQFETAPEAGWWRFAPGDSGDSALWGRPRSEGIMRMPPIGVSRLDPLAAELLPAWIDARTDCDDGS